MNQGYRDDLAAAQARIAELEAQLAGGGSPDIAALEQKHAALVRAVPTKARVGLLFGLSAFITVITGLSMLFLVSQYDTHPRFTVAIQMVVIASSWFGTLSIRQMRASALQNVATHERLLASERARAALESRVRVADQTRVAAAEPLSEDGEEQAAAGRHLSGAR